MKQLTLIAFFSLFLLGIGNMHGQSVAHVNSNAILEAMPEYKTAQTRLETEANRHKTEVERRQAEMQNILNDAQKQMEAVQNKSEAEQRALMQKLQPVQEDLQKKQEELMQYQQTAATELNKLESDLVKPIYSRVETAIQAVGDAQKVGYIMDTAVMVSSGAVLYFKGGKDLTEEVKKQLGVK
ncbi:MAG: OmpH family outer membrane protein [Flavobacteriaceae bacterium]|nr:OmpH family outer membrane protein [Flavobacteriaceae bacterium]